MDCIFCQIANGQAPASIVLQTDRLVVFDDIHKDAPQHLIIIPKKHLASLNEVRPADRDLLGEILLAAQEAARLRGIGQSGYRVITNTGRDAGQVISHLHWHVLGGRPLGRLVAKPE